MSGGRDELLQQPDLIVGIENGEIGLEADELGMAAQDLAPIEWKVPSHGMPSTDAADEVADALLHLARGLVGEGDGEELARVGRAAGEHVRDAGGQHPRLAGPGAGQHQHGPSSASTASRCSGLRPAR